MIKCQDCKQYIFELLDCVSKCAINEDRIGITNMSCPNAEREDGLKECCETCKHYIESKSMVTEDYCAKGKWGNKFSDLPCDLLVEEMKCNDWEGKPNA